MPQVPSVLVLVRVGATEVLVLDVLVLEVEVALEVVVEVEVTTEPPGPARYQLDTGSPRHSPTVTAL